MIPSIYNQLCFYQNQLEAWAKQKELAHPLVPEYPPTESEDYKIPQSEATLWERMVFRVCTGLDLQAIREFKFVYSPRFLQLHRNRLNHRNSLNPKKNDLRPNATMDLIRLKISFRSHLPESYWVDRELSVFIQDLALLEEMLRNHRLTECQGKTIHPDSTEDECLNHHPIESQFEANVQGRLDDPGKGTDYEPEYDEATDTFSLVLYRNSVYGKYTPVMQGMKVVHNWVNISLTKRLEQDNKRREVDQSCKLLFAQNEIYEERLEKAKQRQMVINACCVTSFVLLSLVGTVFFCQIAGRGKSD